MEASRLLTGAKLVLLLAVVLILVLLATLVQLVVGFLRRVPENLYGISSGMPTTDAPSGPDALTPWLTDLLNDLAGNHKNRPLTFGDLRHGAVAHLIPDVDEELKTVIEDDLLPLEMRGFSLPFFTEPDLEAEAEPSINLRMMTTCLNQGRPYHLPFRTRIFFFDPAEFRQLFPKEVASWVEKCAREEQRQRWEEAKAQKKSTSAAGRYVVRTRASAWERAGEERALLPLPAPHYLPVIVGTRMSLSFPLLLSAVPLYAIDLPHPAQPGGGKKNTQLLGETKSTPPLKRDDARFTPWFVDNTTQSWQDDLNSTVPGHRDSIIQVRLRDGEGGVNLEMDPTIIDTLRDFGKMAAQEVNDDYDWNNHRWVKFRTTMNLFEKAVVQGKKAYKAHQEDYEKLIQGKLPFRASRSAYALNKTQRKKALELMRELGSFIERWEKIMKEASPKDPEPELFARGAPRPETELRTETKL